MREALRDILRSFDFKAETFSSSEDYLTRALSLQIDCIVLDVRMPGLSGIELQRKLNEIGRRPPIIFMTSYFDDHTRSAAMAGGAHDFLGKPVDDEVFFQSIKSALDSSVFR
jgi:FixJ family two-component response regulator